MLRKVIALFSLSATSVLACASGTGSESDETDLHAWDPIPCPAADEGQRLALEDITKVASTCFDVPPPDPGPLRPFAAARSYALSYLGALHQGRDELLAVGEPQWVLGHFLYGTALELPGEEIDVWLLRGCSGTWEKLGTTRTTERAGLHAPVDGVADGSSRVFFPIPADKKLGVGRHRIRMVVAGDHTFADQYIEVLPRGTPLLVSDVDGTLTERNDVNSALVCDEESLYPALARFVAFGSVPNTALHEGASALYQSVVKDGYRPVYLTARPEFLVGNTRAFLRESGRKDGRGDLPIGIVHTTLSLTGATNAAAQAFKTNELAAFVAKGFKLAIGIGNRMSDVGAYDAAQVASKFFYENPSTKWRTCSDVDAVNALPRPFTKLTGGDYRFASFADLTAAFAAVPPVCPTPLDAGAP